MNLLPLLPITCGYARVSKSDDEARNLDTQLLLLANHGIREDLIFTDVASGRTMNRPGWRALMDRFSRHFEEGVRIRAELTARDIGIVALREHIDTTQNSAAAKFFRKFFRGCRSALGPPPNGQRWRGRRRHGGAG